MDSEKIAYLLKSLRKEKNLTQKQVAEILNLSDKTISKWERAKGLPDISVLNEISHLYGINVNEILKGTVEESEINGGNMKNLKYYICPVCGSITLSTGNVSLSCCSRTITPVDARKAEPEEKLTVEVVEDEWFISSDHPMTKDNYISFVAFAKGESIQLIKQYPQWNLQLRIQKRGHGTLLWYDTEKGLLFQYI